MAVIDTPDTYAPAGFRYYCPKAPNFSPNNYSVKGCRLVPINEAYLLIFFGELVKPLYVIRHELLKKIEGTPPKSELPRMKAELLELNKSIDDIFDSRDGFADKMFQRQVFRLSESCTILEDEIALLEIEPDEVVRVPFTGSDAESYRTVFDSIEIYALQVRVVLWNGVNFSVERVPDRNARKMPPIKLLNPDLENGKALLRLSYKTFLSGKNSSERVVFDSDFLKLTALGQNPLPYEEQRRRGNPDLPSWPDYVLRSEVPTQIKPKQKKALEK